MSFYAGNACYAVDAALVQELVRKLELTPVPAAPGEVLGIANRKGMVVTILSVDALLGRASAQAASTVNAVIFRPFGGVSEQMGLAIDRPGALVQIDDSEIKPPSGAAAGLSHISGLAKLDETPCSIIDMDSIINRFREDGPSAAAPEARGGPGNEANIR